MMTSDHEIIQAVLGGQEARFAELFERYQHRLYGLLWHVCRDRELAEDIGQETFLRAYRKLHLYSGEALFFTWLARVAMNLLISYRRKKRIESQVRREGLDEVLDSTAGNDNPVKAAELTETQHYVHQALGMLDEDRRVVLIMRDFDGMDYESIASILELPIGTVRSRIHRARVELKSLIQSKVTELGIVE